MIRIEMKLYEKSSCISGGGSKGAYEAGFYLPQKELNQLF